MALETINVAAKSSGNKRTAAEFNELRNKCNTNFTEAESRLGQAETKIQELRSDVTTLESTEIDDMPDLTYLCLS